MINRYMTKSLEQLFKAYQFENDRIDKKDAEITKALIEKEIRRRVNLAFILLDRVNTEKEVEQVYKQFIEH